MITLGVVCWGDEGVTSLTSPRGWWGGQAGREGGSTEAFVGFHQLALLCSVLEMQEGGEDWARDGQDVEYPGSAQEELHDEWFVRTVDINTAGLV